jgi:hypothetical protein
VLRPPHPQGASVGRAQRGAWHGGSHGAGGAADGKRQSATYGVRVHSYIRLNPRVLRTYG